eukprot:gnl/Trimastix_PCT/3925.p1 GENE.gnl/Trimastix_PCT/3925~~gnl/Trimastix_PCT/3925.p1  ORF type:complete len:339 (+),score=30.61 gnl/Trimastix_PCT/3925:72-1088(+)
MEHTPEDGFYRDKHVHYIRNLNKDKNTFEYVATEHLRVSGIYWGLAALDILGELPTGEEAEELISFILQCQQPDGGFGGSVGHDSHLLYTLSAVQVLAILGALDRIDKESIVQFVQRLQQPNGSFHGDSWCEVDTRFSYCAVCCLRLLGRLDAIDCNTAAEFIHQCRNFDGAFGCVPGAESHGGQIFCCVGALAILNRLDLVDADLLGWWLCERQLPCGGLNGRPEKLEDVCYSWWILSALAILRRLHWINGDALAGFILTAQDAEDGGIADRPGDLPDAFHTFFGIAGLSLLGKCGLPCPVNPVYALSHRTLESLGIDPALPALPCCASPQLPPHGQ